MMTMPMQSQRPRILVVDDDPNLARLLSDALHAEGYEVAICEDTNSVIQQAKEFRPAAVILDVVMRGIDGFSILRELRNSTYGRRIPVVLTSGAWRVHEKQREIGATRTEAPTVVLPKPFNLQELERCLQMLGVKAQ